ncbi:MAG: sulfatase-like hydrolase/transferase, partial [Planctomycetota bacterium]
ARSIDFLETRDPERPFFLWTSFSDPHPPYECDPRFWQLYDGMDLPEAVIGDWSADSDAIPAVLRSATLRLNRVDRFSAQQIRQARRAYYACISQIDDHLGRLWGQLQHQRLLDSTWIIFTSDHGDMLGDHHLGAKTIYQEGAAHIPFLIRPPQGVLEAQRGQRCPELICLADILPTVLHACGLADRVPAAIDGEDVTPLMSGGGNARSRAGAPQQDRRYRSGGERLRRHVAMAGRCDLLLQQQYWQLPRGEINDGAWHHVLITRICRSSTTTSR